MRWRMPSPDIPATVRNWITRFFRGPPVETVRNLETTLVEVILDMLVAVAPYNVVQPHATKDGKDQWICHDVGDCWSTFSERSPWKAPYWDWRRNKKATVLPRTQEGLQGYHQVSMHVGNVTSCHVGHQEVTRCCTRGESEEFIAWRWESTQARDPHCLWNLRQHHQKSKQGCQWPQKKACVLQNLKIRRQAEKLRQN